MDVSSFPPEFSRDGKPLFTGIEAADIGRYVVFTVRDPLHDFQKPAAEEIADFLEGAHQVADTKMFATYSGTYRGAGVSVCAGGSGAPELELAMVDFLRWTSADTFVRVGTCGALQRAIGVGDIVISSAAVRDEGTSREYVRPTYPAVANYEVVLALVTAAERVGCTHHVGITRSNDAIYVGDGRPAIDYLQEEHRGIPRYWEAARVLNVERETSLLLTLANLFGKRGGSVCTVVDNDLTGSVVGVGAGKRESILVALEAFAILEEWDRRKESLGRRYLSEESIRGGGLPEPEVRST
jgi:uridine phosphorylase